jgi:hypothetical protein
MARYKQLIIIPVIICLVIAWWLYGLTLHQSSFNGIPDVPCIDPTKPFLQEYSVYINIQDQTNNLKLDTNIGHDPGNCLKVIHTNDASGIVFIQSNDNYPYTLGNFFQVWHKNFSTQQFLSHNLDQGHLDIMVNGQQVESTPDIPLIQNSKIEITYR